MGSESGDAVEDLALKLLEPVEVTRDKLLYHIRRAKGSASTGTFWTPWRGPLLEAATKTKINKYKGRVIKSLLARLIAKIELHTMKGKVLMLGLQRALSRIPGFTLMSFSRLLRWAREKLNYILYLGRSLIVVELYFASLKEML